MALLEVIATRSDSSEPIGSRWKPVDLYCTPPGAETDEILVRTKLVRDSNCAAMCISEAVAHRVMEVLEIPVADAYAVVVREDFAADLTAQYGFEPPVIPGRHWGTRLISEALPETLWSYPASVDG